MAKQIIFLAFIAFIKICASNAEYTDADCREMGYIKSQLMCTACNKLDDFELESLRPHCTECCTEDQSPSPDRRYPKAILEVCTCKFRAYPQIQAFLQSERPQKFPNLEIRYVRGLDPVIKLLDENKQIRETLSITKWNTDTIEEFFETHLDKKVKFIPGTGYLYND